jgi:putative permease
MIIVLKSWFNRYFSDPQAVLLAILLLAGFTIVMTMSAMLLPVLVSIVIAYLLDGLIKRLEGWHIPPLLVSFLVYSTFITLLGFILIVLLPLLSNQLFELIQKLPDMIAKGHQIFMQLPERFPNFITAAQVERWRDDIQSAVRSISPNVIFYSLASIPAIITFLVYVTLVPLLVFFFLKDKRKILGWFVKLLPENHTVAKDVWTKMDEQLGNYIRGKVYEVLLVGMLTYFPFAYFDLNYTTLLAVLVGLSVIVPYIGTVAVAVPILLVAYFQWGFGSDTIWVFSLFAIIQFLDGNILTPLLFSETVNLHPVAIITAVLVFGGIWGFWGVFFAIPLATLVKVLLAAWPRKEVES